MKQLLGTSPRTTIISLLLGVALIVQEAVEKGKVNWVTVLLSVIIFILGRLMKDSDGVHRTKSKKVAKKVLPGDLAKPIEGAD